MECWMGPALRELTVTTLLDSIDDSITSAHKQPGVATAPASRCIGCAAGRNEKNAAALFNAAAPSPWGVCGSPGGPVEHQRCATERKSTLEVRGSTTSVPPGCIGRFHSTRSGHRGFLQPRTVNPSGALVSRWSEPHGPARELVERFLAYAYPTYEGSGISAISPKPRHP
jgi:hypothetical protein